MDPFTKFLKGLGFTGLGNISLVFVLFCGVIVFSDCFSCANLGPGILTKITDASQGVYVLTCYLVWIFIMHLILKFKPVSGLRIAVSDAMLAICCQVVQGCCYGFVSAKITQPHDRISGDSSSYTDQTVEPLLNLSLVSDLLISTRLRLPYLLPFFHLCV